VRKKQVFGKSRLGLDAANEIQIGPDLLKFFEDVLGNILGHM
jgi:hypothetical protein